MKRIFQDLKFKMYCHLEGAIDSGEADKAIIAVETIKQNTTARRYIYIYMY